jgi:hypothetical protein
MLDGAGIALTLPHRTLPTKRRRSEMVAAAKAVCRPDLYDAALAETGQPDTAPPAGYRWVRRPALRSERYRGASRRLDRSPRLIRLQNQRLPNFSHCTMKRQVFDPDAAIGGNPLWRGTRQLGSSH